MDELQVAQRALQKRLGKARAGEDRELATRVRENGEGLAQMLVGLLKMSRVHAPDNRAFDTPAAEFARALAALQELVGNVQLVAVEDQVYVNEVRLRGEGKAGIRELGGELRRQNVGGITFHQPLADRQVRTLVAGLAGPPADPYPRTALRQRLASSDVPGLELQGVFRFRTTEDLESGAIDPVGALNRIQELTREAYEALQAGRVFNPLPLRRSVAELLEIGPLSPQIWDAWVCRMRRREHGAGVALHALLLGAQARLPRDTLQDLGVAALVHDVGYAAMGGGAELSGPDGLSRHPGEGARVLLRQRGFSDAKVRRLRAVLDHHRGHAEPRGAPSGLGSILRIAEDYANFLRIYGQRISACDVLGAMAQAGGTLYHPALLRLFVNGMGRFPPGTLLELADGRRVRSTSPATSPQRFAAPLARLCDQAGAPSGEVVDLAQGAAIRRALPG